MPSFAWKERVLLGGILAGLVAAMPIASTVAQRNPAPPDFSSNLAGWVGLGGGGPGYEPAPGRTPAPVVSDPQHPFVPNGQGNQRSFRIADLSNPNLMPWVKERMMADIDEILAGKKSAFTAQSSCVPAGVPFFMGYGGPDPILFLPTPQEGWMILQGGNQVRDRKRTPLNSSHLGEPHFGL